MIILKYIQKSIHIDLHILYNMIYLGIFICLNHQELVVVGVITSLNPVCH